MKFKAAFTLLCLVFLAGCGEKAGTKGDVVATVNGENIYVQDLDMAVKYSRDAMEKVNSKSMADDLEDLIHKRVLIQEAKKMRLDERDKFVGTIKNFWEQTLIRDLVEEKEKELSASVKVSGAEIAEYYKKMSDEITFKILKSSKLETLKKGLVTADELIKWDREIGPVSYEDGYSEVMSRIFDVPQGTKRIIEGDGVYYLVYVTKRASANLKPVGEMEAEIRAKVKALKIRDDMEKWMEGLKKNAKVNIDKKVLDKVLLKV